jgi:hypothetical protein
MKTLTTRKEPRFFVVNPITDRRLEFRFETSEEVHVRLEETREVFPALATEIGRYGMKIETNGILQEGTQIQVAFLNDPENIRVFGLVVWSKKKEDSSVHESGLVLDSWHGIVMGKDSWKKHKGILPKRDRREKYR